MAKRSGQTFLKRQKELARKEKQRQKAERRQQRKEQRAEEARVAGQTDEGGGAGAEGVAEEPTRPADPAG